MSEVSVDAIPEAVVTANKPDQDETPKVEVSPSEPKAGEDAGATETILSIGIKTKSIGTESNNNELTKYEKDTDAPDQEPNTKRKLSDPESTGGAGVTNEASPIKRIKTEPDETELNNNKAVNSVELEAIVIKMEPDDDGGINNEANKTEPKINEDGKPIKQEPDDAEVKSQAVNGNDLPSTVPADICSSSTSVSVKTEPTGSGSPVAVKTEPTQSNGQGATGNNSSVVSSSTTRPSCRFGIRCYRRNPAHRSAEAHPYDDDYHRPDFPEPPLGTPACPFGNSCYRRNPVHFQRQSHPPDFNSVQNVVYRLRQRTNQNGLNDGPPDALTDDEEDPFGGDSDIDADYNPGDDNANEDDEEELEFESQRVNSDEYD